MEKGVGARKYGNSVEWLRDASMAEVARNLTPPILLSVPRSTNLRWRRIGYLHRDGTVAQPAKGNIFKGPFHIPRMLVRCCA